MVQRAPSILVPASLQPYCWASPPDLSYSHPLISSCFSNKLNFSALGSLSVPSTSKAWNAQTPHIYWLILKLQESAQESPVQGAAFLDHPPNEPRPVLHESVFFI